MLINNRSRRLSVWCELPGSQAGSAYCVLMWRKGVESSLGSPFIRTPILFEGSTLRASQRPHLIPSSWGVSFNIEIGGGGEEHKHSDCSRHNACLQDGEALGRQPL